ncbi:protein-S-isoprenylcysteine O-methyltransferase [Tateyamaria sp. syn59]|uniref:protein-S-isoprenylcysteine O-methyltransferase n=1 Tax=Tateyamaria sp. syn59 TaxID=2576942 RepID=UPI0011BE61B7|nr:protein-S-isoprenylcysteine O-methyltransferase [Tateyamaria sp. syn59]
MIGAAIPYVIMLAAAVAATLRGSPYSAIEFLVLMGAWYTVRMYLTWGEEKPVNTEKDARRERILAGLVGAGMVFLPILTISLPIIDFASYITWPGQFVIGMLVGALGTYVFWCAHRDLGKNWSAHLEVREKHTLVTNGIYGRVRHPMYTAIFLLCLAQALILTNWIAGPAGLVFFTLLYVTRVGPEEAMMEDQFGDQWRSYAERTPRLIPSLGRV